MTIFHAAPDCRLHYEWIAPDTPESDAPKMGAETNSTPTPAILINGTLQTTANWKPLGNFLPPGRPALLYDARGQGRSDLGAAPLSPEQHAQDLLALMDHVGIAAAHLIGVSHGAHIALTAAAIAPDRVRRLILCGIGDKLDGRGRSILNSWRHILDLGGLPALAWAAIPMTFGRRFLEQAGPMLGGMVAAMVRRNSEVGLRAHLAALEGYPSAGELAGKRKRRHAALMISGQEDMLAPPESAIALAKTLEAELKSLAGIGHGFPAESASTLRSLMETFLD